MTAHIDSDLSHAVEEFGRAQQRALLEYEFGTTLEELQELNALKSELANAEELNKTLKRKNIELTKNLKLAKQKLSAQKAKAEKQIDTLRESNEEKEKEVENLKRKFEEMSNSTSSIPRCEPAAKKRRSSQRNTMSTADRLIPIPEIDNLETMDVHLNFKV